MSNAIRHSDLANSTLLTTWIQRAAGGLAIALVVLSSNRLSADEPPKQAIQITIPNMHCESCAKKIRGHLFTIKGVAKVTTFVGEQRADVIPAADKTVSAYELWDKLEQAKYPPTKLVTPTQVYTEKPPRENATPAGNASAGT